MDVGRIVVALKASMNPDEHAAAKEYLESCRKIIGFTPALLNVVLSSEMETSVRQAAVVYIKNMVTAYWSEHGEEEQHGDSKVSVFVIHEQDRYVIRECIIDAIIQSPEVIRVQLAQCIRIMLMSDFPGRWPQIVPKIVECLSSPEGEHCYAGLIALLQLVKNYSYKKIKDQAPIVQPVKNILPILHQRFVQLLANTSQESMMMQKLIIKCCNALVQYNFHPGITTPDHFVDWMNLMCQVVDQPLPKELDTIDVEDRPEQIWCKVKKWASRLMDNAFEQMARSAGGDQQLAPYHEAYMKRCAEPAVRTMLNVLHKYKSQEYVTPFLLHRAITLLHRAVAEQHTWKLLKDSALGMIMEIVFPLLCYKEEDEELWENDPQEYIRSKYDILSDIVDPAVAGASFVSVCIKKRKMLSDVMSIVQHVFCQKTATPSQLDGALRLVGLISSHVIKKAELMPMVAAILGGEVVPRLENPNRFLRAQACWCIKQYAHFKFENHFSLEPAMSALIKGILHDPELPVKFEAALALEMVLYEQTEAKAMIVPHLRDILLQVLDLLKKTVNDELNTVIAAIISVCEEEIIPIADDIINELCNIFVQMTAVEEVDEECNITAMGILATIQTLLDAAENHPEVIKQLEMVVLMLVNTIFERNLSDHVDQAFVLICCLNYTEVSDALWKFYPAVYQAFKKCDGIEYFSEIMPVLYNYVVVGSEKFLDDPDRLRMLLAMCSEVFGEKSMEDSECFAAKLLETVLLEFRTRIDGFVRPIMEMILNRMSKEVFSKELQALCMNVLIAALLYDASVTLDMLSSSASADGSEPLLDHFIKHWVSEVDIFTGVHNRKLAIMGLCALLDMQPRPGIVNQLSQSFLPCCITLFDGLEKAYIAKAAEEEEESEESDDSYESSDSGSSIVDNLNKGEDSQMDEAQTETLEDEDDDDDDSENAAEYEEYETLIDRKDFLVNEYVLFKDTLTTIQQRDPQWYMALVSLLTDEHRKQLEKVAVVAEQKRIELNSRRLEQQLQQAAGV